MSEKSSHNIQQYTKTGNLIIKNLKHLLAAQHKNLKQYLNLLEKEKAAILSEDMDKISVYIELENRFNTTLTACDKALTNWKKKYQNLVQNQPARDIQEMFTLLQELTEQAYQANTTNKTLVKEKLALMKKELAALPFRSYKVSSPYKKIGTPNFIDISS
ncbi:MAG: flagellar export chaperone FlgN [Spirochaetales bacterium]|nr:flagellar export chaperone FlgN [Spirochaetales bacterium]